MNHILLSSIPGIQSSAEAGLEWLDYIIFGLYFVVLTVIGLWVGRHKSTNSEDYFLAGKSLPWYAVGGSFIASNISSEHFIGMVGAAFTYGIVVATSEWRNIWTFSLLIWFFIPFLLASGAFTIPEFLEKRFNNTLRQFFAFVTILCNITAFLAAVLYGGGLALHELFGWGLSFSIIILAVVAGSWAIYGGFRSVVWTDFFTVIVMIAGGIIVTVLGLKMLADGGSIIEGFQVMIERNKADFGLWKEAVATQQEHLLPNHNSYNRLSIFQPIDHPTHPWPFMIVGFLSVSIWYNVLNQFMIQRVLGAKNIYHARMGIVFAGYLKVLMPVIVVLPGLILFAQYPGDMLMDWEMVKPNADQGYIRLIQQLVPIGLRGLLLAALFGAIQSTVNSVLNSTATIFTLDIYKRVFYPKSSESRLVRVGVISSVIILLISIGLALVIQFLEGVSLFVYIQTLFTYFAPPFSAIFLLGILWKRINAFGATVAVFSGFAVRLILGFVEIPFEWLTAYEMQAIFTWGFSAIVCVIFSLLSAPPPSEKIQADLVLNFKKLNLKAVVAKKWYKTVFFWWGLYVVLLLTLFVIFSGSII
ncbi:sodium/solute symporter [Gramella sp. AN32]|uniref:SLC5 family protein n=1 Tax=Christiangramia antarctica TaxID=2058158 RepID=A0ABW5X5F8_9FLAO|nr:sodium/solute symporter [Gramella sp. AN32]MCM4155760.1 Na+/glucose cotransporter [Gramella sp. AN32]